MPTSSDSSSGSTPDPLRDIFRDPVSADTLRHAVGDTVKLLARAASWAEVQRKVRMATVADNTRIAWQDHTQVPGDRRGNRPSPRLGHRTGQGRRRIQAVALGVSAIASVAAIAVFWNSSADPRQASPNAVQEQATGRGQRATMTLPDGSRVVLAPESRFTYAEGPDRARIAELEGAAVFTVPNAQDRPFIVRAAGAETRVLGTEFLVRRYADDGETKIVVTEGRVGVTATHMAESNVVMAGEIATVRPDGVTKVVAIANVHSELAWTQGELRFVDTPLRQVVADLVRMRSMDIRLASPSLGDRPITAVVPESMRTGDIISLLANVVSLRVQRHGAQYLLME